MYSDPNSDQSMNEAIRLIAAHGIAKSIPWVEVAVYFQLSTDQTLVKLGISGALHHKHPTLTSTNISQLSEFVVVDEIPEKRYRELLLKALNADGAPTDKS